MDSLRENAKKTDCNLRYWMLVLLKILVSKMLERVDWSVVTDV